MRITNATNGGSILDSKVLENVLTKDLRHSYNNEGCQNCNTDCTSVRIKLCHMKFLDSEYEFKCESTWKSVFQNYSNLAPQFIVPVNSSQIKLTSEGLKLERLWCWLFLKYMCQMHFSLTLKSLTTSKQSIIFVSLSSGRFFSRDTLQKSRKMHT